MGPVGRVPAANAVPPDFGVRTIVTAPAAAVVTTVMIPALLVARVDTFLVDEAVVMSVTPRFNAEALLAAFSATALLAEAASTNDSATRARTV